MSTRNANASILMLRCRFTKSLMGRATLIITAIAMVVAIATLEVIIPLFNNAANKNLTLNYLGTLPWLVITTLLVGLFAGMYPAWLITRAAPIDALRDIARKGKKGSTMRSVMIGVQFGIYPR